MKKFFFAIIMAFSIQNAFSKVFVSEKNNIVEISAYWKSIKLNDKLVYYLCKYTCKDKKEEYYISFAYDPYSSVQMHLFPHNTRLLLKTFGGETIELTSILVDKNFAYFPVSEEQLNCLFHGICKIRFELVSYDKKKNATFLDMPEKEFNNDVMGKALKKMYEEIAKEETNIKKKEPTIDSNTLRKDISSGF